MKFIVVVCVLAGVDIISAYELTDEKVAETMKQKMDCLSASGITEKVLMKAKHEGIFDDEINLSKYFVCFGKKVGFLNEIGVLQVDTIRSRITAFFNADIAEKIITKCTKEKYESIEKTSFNFAKCSYRYKPRH